MNQKFTRIQLIQRFIDKLKAERYLEIGVLKGTVLFRINCKLKIGVDPKFRISTGKRISHNLRYKLSNQGTLLVEMTSDDFFKDKVEHLIEKPPQVVFIDGLHTFEQTLKDVYNTLNFLNKSGVIILHDCNPPHKASATPALSIPEAKQKYESENNDGGWTGEWCGDTWKVIPYLLKFCKELDVCVLDADYGLGIVSRKVPCDPPRYAPTHYDNRNTSEFSASLSYADLEADRQGTLNLKKLSDLDEIIRNHSRMNQE